MTSVPYKISGSGGSFFGQIGVSIIDVVAIGLILV